MSSTPAERLTRAAASEQRAWDRLRAAARLLDDTSTSTADELRAAAKAWTNAMHQRSRCEKHVREASS